MTRMLSATTIDSCLELVMLALSAYLFSGVQMKAATKLVVIGAFCFRVGYVFSRFTMHVASSLPPPVHHKASAEDKSVIAIFVAYFFSYRSFRQYATDNIDVVDNLVWQQALLAYSLMSATIPNLKGFLGRFQTGDLAKLSESEIMGTNGSSFVLSTMDLRDRRGKSTKAEAVLTPGSAQLSLRAYAEGSRRADNNGSIKSFGSAQGFFDRGDRCADAGSV